MIFPALLDAADDPIFIGHPNAMAVYVYLIKRLDFGEFRRVRASRVAADRSIRPETAGAALKMLRRHGYIIRGKRVLEVFTYRLVFARKHDQGESA